MRYKILFLLVVYSVLGFGQPLNRSIVRTTQYLSTDSIRPLSADGISVSDAKVKTLADPVEGQDAVNLRSLQRDYPTREEVNTTIETTIGGVVVDSETRLISGTVAWISGLTYKASDLVYKISGKTYTAAGRYITLSSANPTLGRIDVIYVDEYSNIGVHAGTPNEDPVKPVVLSTELEVTIAIVGAGATIPSNIDVIKVYDENDGEPSEWTGTAHTETYTTLSLSNTGAPQNGSKNIKISIDVPPTTTEVGTRYVGEAYQGGVIFWLSSNGKSGLIAATSGLTPSVYQNGAYTNGTQNNVGIGYGAANTAVMMAASASNQTGMAAPRVTEYVKDGYDDWFLPSKEELYTLWLRRTSIGGFRGMRYWSSTEALNNSANRAVGVNFANGNYVYDNKSNVYGVRPIRSFDDSSILPSEQEVTKYTPSNTYISFVDNALVSAEEGLISFWVKSSQEWLSESGIRIDLYKSNTMVGSAVMSITSNMYGYVSSDTTYQHVAIRLSAFSALTMDIDEVRFGMIRNWPNGIDVFVDNIMIQQGTMAENPSLDGYRYWVYDDGVTTRQVFNKDTVRIDAVQRGDSIVQYVTPKQLSDSLATTGGGGSINDSLYVHRALGETITGEKTFSRSVSGSIHTPVLNVVNTYSGTAIAAGIKSMVNGTNSSSAAILGVGQNNTVGIYGTSTSGYGVYGTSSTGSGIYGTSINGVGVQTFSNNGVPLSASNYSSSGTANTVTTIINISRSTSGTAANGIGSKITFNIKTTDGLGYESGYIVNKWENATYGSETSVFEWWLRNNGAAIAKKMDLQSDGTLNVVGNISMGSVLKMTPLADPPTSPSLGWIYVDTDTHIYMYNGTTWKQLDN